MSSLYIHVPFCRRKCPYCDFYSVSGHEQDLADYPDLLIGQIEQLRAEHGRYELQSVFLGGGTPTLLPSSAVGAVLEAVDAAFPFTPDAEISLEANPGTVTLQSLKGYLAAGVNRLSFGIQSLDERQLRRLGRIHTPEQARQALRLARRAGFDNLSADLMFALPGQSLEALLSDVDELADGVEHLSCYGLSVEEDTPFYHLHRRGDLQLPSEEVYAEHFLAVDAALAEAGMRHYEVSNFARPARECRHNLAYWRRSTCLALGAGAHAFYDVGWGQRRAVPSGLQSFRRRIEADRNAEELIEDFDRRGAMSETLYLGLRTAEGVSERRFRERFGCGVAEAFPGAVDQCGERLRLEEGRWRFAPRDWLLFDALIMPFLG